MKTEENRNAENNKNEKKSHKIGVIGEESVVKGFLSLGFSVKGVSNSFEAQNAMDELIKDECAIVYITSDFYEKIDTEKYKGDSLFTVIPIPSPNVNSKVGEERLKKFVEKAVGADILFSK